MIVEKDIPTAGKIVRALQGKGRTVGFVPTMGSLHDGHASLIRAARGKSDFVVVSIFVNPTQFGPDEDLETYPRPWEHDRTVCESLGVDLVFTPTVDAMYGRESRTTVRVSGLTRGLCGRHRKEHFDGVTTVVAKLFSIIACDFAFFGEKDYQQMVVIRRMVRDLNMPIEIVACPTVREDCGLAMSSRNRYLSTSQRKQASALNKALLNAADRVRDGERDSGVVTEAIRAEIKAAGPASIDYVDIVDAQSLDLLAVIDRPARICLAVRIGSCRLIDNIGVDALAGGG